MFINAKGKIGCNLTNVRNIANAVRNRIDHRGKSSEWNSVFKVEKLSVGRVYTVVMAELYSTGASNFENIISGSC